MLPSLNFGPGPASGRIYLAPDAGATGGAGGAGGSGTGASGGASGAAGAASVGIDANLIAQLVGANKGVNLDQTISLGNGRAYTIGQLIQAQQELEGVRPEVAESKRAKEALRALYGKEAPKDEVARSNMEYAFTQAGWSAEEAKAKVDELFKAKAAAAGNGGTDEDDGADDADDGEELRDSLIRQQVDNHIVTSVGAQMGNKAIKDIVDLITKRDDETAGKEVEKEIRERVLTGVKVNLKKRMNDAEAKRKAGQRVPLFDLNWIQEEAAAVAKVVAEKVMRFTGDPGKIGRTLGVAGGDPFSVLPATPVAVPSGKEFIKQGKTQSELELAMDERTSDALLRAAKQVVLAGV